MSRLPDGAFIEPAGSGHMLFQIDRNWHGELPPSKIPRLLLVRRDPFGPSKKSLKPDCQCKPTFIIVSAIGGPGKWIKRMNSAIASWEHSSYVCACVGRIIE